MGRYILACRARNRRSGDRHGTRSRSTLATASAVWSTAGKQCEESAKQGLENYCDHMILTWQRVPRCRRVPRHTLGGYSQQIAVHERYALHIRHPKEQQLPPWRRCSARGITTYQLRHWNVGQKKSALWALAGWDIWELSWLPRHGRPRGGFTFTPESKRKRQSAGRG